MKYIANIFNNEAECMNVTPTIENQAVTISSSPFYIQTG